MGVNMKKMYLAFLAAIIISGLFVGQVSAAASSSETTSQKCGKTYTVVGGDTLTTIANKCGISISSIQEFNPSITDSNIIFSGQVIRLTANAVITTTVNTVTSSSSSAEYYGNASIILSDNRTYAGHSIVVNAKDFPPNSAIRIYIYNKASSMGTSYDATTNSNGGARKSITVPSYAYDQQIWEVKVITTNQLYVTSAVSSEITIIISSDDDDNVDVRYPDAEVTLSRNTVNAGGSVTVYVKDFPKNQSIQFCVHKKTESSCAVMYYATTNNIGYAQLTVTIPSNARTGDNWAVFVKTVNLSDMVSDVSSRITIK